MTPPIKPKSKQTPGNLWLGEWNEKSEPGAEKDSGKEEADQSPRQDIWDELEKIDEAHKKTNAEAVISHLEERLSHLTSGRGEEPEDDDPVHSDPFSARHRQVIEKGADRE